jgi:hypothetical protein
MDDDNKLVAWGGRDTWIYAWEPELRGLAADVAVSGAAVAAASLTSIMEVIPNSMLTFAKNAQGDYSSQIEIKNTTSEPIVYKVRTCHLLKNANCHILNTIYSKSKTTFDSVIKLAAG